MPCRPHRPRPRGIVNCRTRARRRDLEVEAGAERAVAAGQDRDRLALVPVEGEESIAQQARGFRIDGVARLGETVDRDGRDRTLGFDRDLGHGQRPCIMRKGV